MTSGDALKCTVVVCAYTRRRWPDLTAAAAALGRQTRPPDQVLVVVDHNPGLLAAARAEFGGMFTVLANRNARGLSGARNTGVDQADGDVVVFLDDDAEPADDWLGRLLAPYSDATVIGVGGAAVPSWDEVPPRWLAPELNWVVGCSYQGLPQTLAPIRNPIGANMSFRRIAFTVGGFAYQLGRIGTLPAGCEETEFAIRATAAFPGSRILYAPDAVVRHRVTPDRTTWRYLLRRCYAEGRSKAAVARLVGTGSALASEQAYLRRTLPRAVGRELRQRNPGALLAVLAAVATAGAGYGRERLRSVSSRSGPSVSEPSVRQSRELIPMRPD